MKKRYFVFGFLTIFFVTVSTTVSLFVPQDETENLQPENFQTETAYRDEIMEQFDVFYASYTRELEELLDAFMALTYNCNYQERHYYDGAQEFMTEECFSYYVPMTDPETVEGTFSPYVSSLNSTDYYYGSITGNRAECLARISYSASGRESDTQESYLLLSLIRVQGQWKINGIKTLDHS